MKKTTAFIIGVCFGLGLYFGFDAYRQSHIEKPEPSIIRDTIYDTIPYRMPVPYDSAVIRYITKTLPVTDTIKDSVILRPGDTLPVTIPITQKQYNDSTFTAWISGYAATLDSINVYQKTHIETIFQPTYIPSKPKRWGLGIQVGAGVAPNKITPYIGIGVSYNIVTW